jgi:hypothetical protein
MKLCSVLILSAAATNPRMAWEEIPWASGVLRGSGPAARVDEIAAGKSDNTNAIRMDVLRMRPCLSVNAGGVKAERNPPRENYIKIGGFSIPMDNSP